MRQTFLLIPILLAGCGEKAATPPAPPAHAETIAQESELLKLTLTPQAQQRLGIGLVRVGGGSASATREVAGEIVVPPLTANGVPVNSTTNLQQIGSQQAAADAELARATAQARLARIALDRAESLVREEAGMENRRLQIREEVWSAGVELERAWASIAANETNVRASEESLRVVQERYQLGAAVITDLLDTQTALARAEGSLAECRWSYLAARAAFERAVGAGSQGATRASPS